ncbi:hypothetical protein ASF25_20040 [Methylobacterium sp. Leaf100]|nr:hypothetical protein ASF25_20040 [Methylobacterium sp. Leaf100]
MRAVRIAEFTGYSSNGERRFSEQSLGTAGHDALLNVGIACPGIVQTTLQGTAGKAEAARDPVDGRARFVQAKFDQVCDASRQVIADRLVLARRRNAGIVTLRVRRVQVVQGKDQTGPSP